MYGLYGTCKECTKIGVCALAPPMSLRNFAFSDELSKELSSQAALGEEKMTPMGVWSHGVASLFHHACQSMRRQRHRLSGRGEARSPK